LLLTKKQSAATMNNVWQIVLARNYILAKPIPSVG